MLHANKTNALSDAPNEYLYVDNHPIKGTDPLGLEEKKEQKGLRQSPVGSTERHIVMDVSDLGGKSRIIQTPSENPLFNVKMHIYFQDPKPKDGSELAFIQIVKHTNKSTGSNAMDKSLFSRLLERRTEPSKEKNIEAGWAVDRRNNQLSGWYGYDAMKDGTEKINNEMLSNVDRRIMTAVADSLKMEFDYENFKNHQLRSNIVNNNNPANVAKEQETTAEIVKGFLRKGGAFMFDHTISMSSKGGDDLSFEACVFRKDATGDFEFLGGVSWGYHLLKDPQFKNDNIYYLDPKLIEPLDKVSPSFVQALKNWNSQAAKRVGEGQIPFPEKLINQIDQK